MDEQLKPIAFKADKDTAKLLHKLAVNGHAGNQSAVIRSLIHAEAQRRGLLPNNQAQRAA